MESAIKPAKILLPKNCEMSLWSTIACDQFTSEKEYWENLESLVKGKPTTLDLTLPEIYLSDNVEERIKEINLNMKKYLESGIFEELKEGFILTVRSTRYVKRRIGLIGALDLEKYDFKPEVKSLVRATEGTIEERIPPRLKIRKDAPLEFPHVMVLFDDEKKKITEKLYSCRSKFKKVYDFELNMGGGHVVGYHIDNKNQEIIAEFNKLLNPKRLRKKYGSEDNFLFAVGDGNHSLATAKAHWDNVKKTLTEEERKTHPARFALCEFVNIYDRGIYFEPIYRVIKGVNVFDFVTEFKKENIGKVEIYAQKKIETVNGKYPVPQKIALIDKFIKEYVEKKGGSVDYIHGKENLERIVDRENAVGILLERIDKKELFRYVSNKGVFPRKTFSMGEGKEKRYYLEGKRIK